MYNLINMPKMERMAFTQEKSLFRELGDMAAYAALSEEDRMAYDADLKAYRDMRGQLHYAWAQGRAGSLAKRLPGASVEERAEIIRSMVQSGLDYYEVASIANISPAEVKRILSSN